MNVHPGILPWLAIAISAASLIFSALAWRRARRGEALQRGRLDISKVRAANLFDGQLTVINLTVKNVGKDTAKIVGMGVEYWIGDHFAAAPKTISVRPIIHHLAPGEEHLFQERMILSDGDLRSLIDNREALYAGVFIEYDDAIGPRTGTWAFHNVIGKVDILDQFLPLRPTPDFLKAPVRQ